MNQSYRDETVPIDRGDGTVIAVPAGVFVAAAIKSIRESDWPEAEKVAQFLEIIRDRADRLEVENAKLLATIEAFQAVVVAARKVAAKSHISQTYQELRELSAALSAIPEEPVRVTQPEDVTK